MYPKQRKETKMAPFQPGQSVILKNPRGPEKPGVVIGSIYLGNGRGRGEFLLLVVEGRTLKARAGRVRAV